MPGTASTELRFELDRGALELLESEGEISYSAPENMEVERVRIVLHDLDLQERSDERLQSSFQ